MEQPLVWRDSLLGAPDEEELEKPFNLDDMEDCLASSQVMKTTLSRVQGMVKVTEDDDDDDEKDKDSSSKNFPTEWPSWRIKVHVFCIRNRWFERVVFTCIVLNCVLASMEDARSTSPLQTVIHFSEFVFTPIYVLEMFIKWVGFGFFKSPYGYFRNMWNVLDFVIVVISVYIILDRVAQIHLFPDDVGMAAMRSVRLIRPLRSISALTSLRLLVHSIISSLRPIFDVVLLYLLVMVVLAVLGVELFKGRLRYRCFEPQYDSRNRTNVTYVVQDPAQTCDITFNINTTEYLPLVSSYACPYGTVCRMYGNPNAGYASFDDFPSAMMLLVYVITMEGWTDLMYTTMDAVNNVASWYYIVSVVVGGLFFLNLALVIINEAFDANFKAEKARVRELRNQLSPLGEYHASGEVTKENFDAAKSSWMKAQRGRANTLLRAVEGRMFHRFFLSLIVLNAILLMCNYDGMPQEMEEALDLSQQVLTFFFALEIALKMAANGLRFFRDGWNLFDVVVIGMSLFDVIGSWFGQPPFFAVSALRCLRLLLLLEHAAGFPDLQRWVSVFSKALRASMMLNVLILLLVFFFALLGVQLFAGSLCGVDESQPATSTRCAGVPRLNFDNLGWSLITVFSLLAGDDWLTTMENGMKGAGKWYGFYYAVFYIIGNYLVLNLCIAVVLNSRTLEASEDPTKIKEQKKSELETGTELLAIASGAQENDHLSQTKNAGYIASLTETVTNLKNNSTNSLEQTFGTKSLFLIPQESKFRKNMVAFLHCRWVEGVLIVAICISTVTLALESPMDPPDSMLQSFIVKVDTVLTYVFTGEVVLKIIACGLVLHGDSYLRRDNWNKLDFIIVTLSLVGLAHEDNKWLRTVKVCRVMRPLRFISKFEGLKLLVNSLVSAMQPLGSVAVISIMVWCLFSTIALQLFRGETKACTQDVWGDRSYQYPYFTTKDSCLNATNPASQNYAWKSAHTNFDHIFSSMLTLYTVATLEGWTNVMLLGIDTVDTTTAPRRDNNPYIAGFFIAYVMIMAFFVLNMFIGVLIDTYSEEKKKSIESNIKLSQEQKEWVSLYRKALHHVKPPQYASYASGSFRDKLQKIAQHKWFDFACYVLVVGNVVLLASDHADSTTEYEWSLSSVDALFVILFVLEITFRFVALGTRTFFEDRINALDFVLMILAVLNTVVDFTGYFRHLVFILRTTRLLRLLRICRLSRGLRTLLKTLVLSVPAFVNVISLLLLLLILFGFIGIRMFHGLKYSDNITRQANFDSVLNAVLLLFRITTGENWQLLMFDAMVQPPYCSPQLNDCGHPIGAPIYFCLFFFLGRYILLNVFIAVILDSFGTASCEEGVVVHAVDMANFREVWHKFDPKDTYLMPAPSLVSFVRQLGPPIAAEVHKKSYNDVMRFLAKLRIPVHSGYVAQQDILDRLLRYDYAVALPPDVEMTLQKLLRQKYKAKARDRKLQLEVGGEGKLSTLSINEIVAAMRIQARWRAIMARKKAPKSLVVNRLLGTPQARHIQAPPQPKPPQQQQLSNSENSLDITWSKI
eukprot:PhF_6_TR36344/c0_g1_i1/m.53273